MKAEVCDKCGGSGVITGILEYNPFDIRTCNKCNGRGQLNDSPKNQSDKERIKEAIKKDIHNVF